MSGSESRAHLIGRKRRALLMNTCRDYGDGDEIVTTARALARRRRDGDRVVPSSDDAVDALRTHLEPKVAEDAIEFAKMSAKKAAERVVNGSFVSSWLDRSEVAWHVGVTYGRGVENWVNEGKLEESVKGSTNKRVFRVADELRDDGSDAPEPVDEPEPNVDGDEPEQGELSIDVPDPGEGLVEFAERCEAIGELLVDVGESILAECEAIRRGH